MKKIKIAISILLFWNLTTSAQQIGKFKFTTTSKSKNVYQPISDSVKKAITTYNSKDKKNNADFRFLINSLKSPAINKNSNLLKLVDSLLLLDSLPAKIDTLPNQPVKSTDDQETLPCEGISSITDLLAEKNDEGEYVFSFVDTAENPIRSFTLKEYNESLFIDKVKEALNSICGNGEMTDEQKKFVDTLIKKISDEKLFDKLLIASLNVKDDDVLAGKLNIFKKFNISIKSYVDSTVNYQKRSSTFQNKKFQQENLDYAIVKNPSLPLKKLHSGVYSFSVEQGKPISKNFINILENSSFANLFLDTNYPVSDSPKVGSITIDKKIRTEIAAFTVYEIQIQFQDGFIENIKVLGKIDGNNHLLKFENAYPIPFSTRRDFRKLYETHIYERTIYAKVKNNTDKIFACSLRLGDLIYYNQNLDINVKDYSPENQVLNKSISQEKTTVNLYKERTSKILELKVFSDLKGIDNDNPNGLIQFELCKKFNFWNMREEIRNFGNYGFFNFITPYFSMNKIENNNKRIILPYMGIQQADTNQANVYASTLKMLQYQTFSLGVNLTAFTVDIPGLKSTINFNTGFYFGRTLFEDTLRTKIDSSNFTPLTTNNIKQFGLNTFQIVPEITLQVFPDKRYGVILSQRFINFKLLNSNVKQVRDSANYTNYIKSLKGDRSKIDDYSAKKWLGSSEIFAFYQPSKYNKIFFRYRFNWDLDNVKTNFHQMQVGLLTYLAHTKKSNKEKDDSR